MISKIINTTTTKSNFVQIENFNFRKEYENELLLFFKPEVFFPAHEYSEKIIEMTINKLSGYKVVTSGMAMLSGDFIKKHEIMDRHYGFINKLSKQAGKIVTDEEKEKIKTTLDIHNINEYKILGGHEFLSEFKNETLDSLGKIWFSKPCAKIRSGFYGLTSEVNNQKIILINGFHPAQLDHFQKSTHKIVIVLVHTNTDWKILKNNLAGNTFPEKAGRDSIRGEIFANKDYYGAETVSANFNFVHLSAGPFEALFEINNFLSCIPATSFKLSETLVGTALQKNKNDDSIIQTCLSNPVIEYDNKPTDLFSFTEEQNTTEAIDNFIKKYL